MKLPRLTDYEVEMRLGYTPCVCGVLDGTWHQKCYLGKKKEQIKTASKRAFQIARVHLVTQDALRANVAIENAKRKAAP